MSRQEGPARYPSIVRRLAAAIAYAFVLAACTGDAALVSSTSTTAVPEATTAPETTTVTATTAPSPTSSVVDSTTTSEPLVQLPVDGDCLLDGVPEGGEATVLVDGRLYGLGADGVSPRCLADGLSSSDIEWGPLGDRVRVGDEILTASTRFGMTGVSRYAWTGPTGSRIVAVATDRLWKVALDDRIETDITFLAENFDAAYHPAGTHLLAIGIDFEGQYGLWLATNQGADPLLLASDDGATIADPAWNWLGEPLFIAEHFDGRWHAHSVFMTEEGWLDALIIVESEAPIDRLLPSRYDPIMLGYRTDGHEGVHCVDGSRTTVNGIDVPEPLSEWTSTPVGWLSAERLLVLAFPDGCDSPADLWSFSAGYCPGSVYDVSLLIKGVDGAAAREAAHPAPPPPDFATVIQPAPA